MERSVDPTHNSDLGITEQAHAWFDIMKNAAAPERKAFAEWLKISPRHVGEFLLVTSVYREFEGSTFANHIDVEALLTDAGSNVISLNETSFAADSRPEQTRSLRQNPLWRRTHMRAAAVLTTVLVAGAAWVWLDPAASRYTTARGELRVVELADGSTLHLNTESRVRIRMNSTSREIELLGGEALFKVAPDPQRPFRVHSGNAVIQAVGTAFNVIHRNAGTTVSVIEGRVAVGGERLATRRYLGAGEGIEVTPAGKITPVSAIDPLKVTAWRQRRLVFRGNTLSEVVAEFNRYNKSLRFKIQDPELGVRKFNGVFDADAPESFVRVLSGVGDLEVDRDGDEVVVRKKAAAAGAASVH